MAALAHLSHHLAAASHGALTCPASHTPGTAAALASPSSFPCPTVFQQPLDQNIATRLILTLGNPKIWNNWRLREMSRRNGKAPKVDLKLNLTRPRVPMTENTPMRSGSTISPTSPPSSCISSEMSQDDLTQLGYYSSSPEAQSMVLAGCQRCLMYVMLSEDDPKCPRCRNTVLLEFMQQLGNHTGSTSSSTSSKRTRKNR